jgi:hypothetical protein
MVSLELSLGQNFMSFFNEAASREAAALEVDRRRAEEADLFQKSQGSFKLEVEYLHPQQGTLFDPSIDKGAAGGNFRKPAGPSEVDYAQTQIQSPTVRRKDERQLEFEAIAALNNLGRPRPGLGSPASTAAPVGAANGPADPLQRLERPPQLAAIDTAPTRSQVGPVKVLAQRVREEMLHRGSVQFTGQKVESLHDVWALVDLARSPQFETSRFFAIRNGVVVGVRSITARIPNSMA